MNEDKQRVAIAKACGWTVTKNWKNVDSAERNICKPLFIDGSRMGQTVKLLPDYLNDLNAWQPIERDLSQKDREAYQCILVRLSCCQYEAIHATAAMRAEAFLKTIGKWEESECT